jgi:menaquinone-dependent protoporphyrinogen oxidase
MDQSNSKMARLLASVHGDAVLFTDVSCAACTARACSSTFHASSADEGLAVRRSSKGHTSADAYVDSRARVHSYLCMSNLENAETLVAYATRGGTTLGIAERIGRRLIARGHAAVVRECSEVHSLMSYRAIVLGSPIYDQRWLPEAMELVVRVSCVESVPVFLFSAGSLGDTNPLFGAFVRREPKGIDAVLAKLNARDYRVFAGFIPADFPWFARLFVRMAGGHIGDNRDWEAIDAWSDEVADALSARDRAMQSEPQVSRAG